MTAARARRRWLRWQRYVRATRTTGPRKFYDYHRGYIKARSAVMLAPPPTLVRRPWNMPAATPGAWR